MNGLGRLLMASFAGAIILSPSVCSGQDAENAKQTREACQTFCQKAVMQKLIGNEQEQFNACADAHLCTIPDPHYYAIGPLGQWG
jgi:hypothetical protein